MRADQGRHHRRRPQRVPRGHRAGRRRARRCARRQRDRLRDGAATRARRASSSWPRCAATSSTAIRAAIHHRTLDVCGLPPRDVMLVQPGTLPKTSSGKLQRAKCREQYLERGARARVIEPRCVKVFASARHRLHHPEHELEASWFQEPFEHPGRAEAIRAALAADDRFELVEPDEWGQAPIEAVHDPGLVAFLETAWQEYQSDVASDARRDPRRVRHARAARGMGPAGEPATGRGPPRDGGASRRPRRSCRARTRRPGRRSTCALSAAGARARRRAVRLRAVPAARAPRHPPRTAATASSTTPRSSPTTSRPRRRPRWPCSTSTTTTATAPSRSSTSATTSQFVSLHGDPVRAYPYVTGFADETGAGRGSGHDVATSRSRRAPTTTTTSPRSPRRCEDDRRRSARRCSSCRSASTPTTAIRSAIWRSRPTASVVRGDGRRARPAAVVLQEGGYADDDLGENVGDGCSAAGGRRPTQPP